LMDCSHFVFFTEVLSLCFCKSLNSFPYRQRLFFFAAVIFSSFIWSSSYHCASFLISNVCNFSIASTFPSKLSFTFSSF
jgi:hypothetical protein